MEHKLSALFSRKKRRKILKKSCVNNDNDYSMLKCNIFLDPKYTITEFHFTFEHYISALHDSSRMIFIE